ncbi:MAG: hypothetical protein P1U63_06215 [Coxiellaceae bacterium]|nr:hypothetical protein [Coxiellaceae bacterium]
MKQKTDKHYVSPADKFLAKFNATHANTASQQAEVDKYNKLDETRDNPEAPESTTDDSLWD